jgi:hypothetical protein
MPLSEFLAIAALATVHVTVHRLKWIDVVPRSRWLSFAGGASVAYVFLHILPELAAHQSALGEIAGGDAYFGEQLAYAVALVGLVTFYGLERMLRTLPHHHEGGYRLHLASFGIYNVLVGYLVFHREAEGTLSLLLFVIALGLHYLTVDYGLRKDHKDRFDHFGRWLLVAAIVLGGVIGWLTRVPEWMVSILFALLAGSILLNVLKEELPAERQSRFLPFVGGAAGYAVVLLTMRWAG